MRINPAISTVLILAVAVILYVAARFTVADDEIVVITTFGEPTRSVAVPGTRFRIPFVQELTRYRKNPRLMEFALPIPCKQRVFLMVRVRTTYSISDPIKYYQTLNSFQLSQEFVQDSTTSSALNVITSLALNQIAPGDDPTELNNTRASFQVVDGIRRLITSPLAQKGLSVNIVDVFVSYDHEHNAASNSDS